MKFVFTAAVAVLLALPAGFAGAAPDDGDGDKAAADETPVDVRAEVARVQSLTSAGRLAEAEALLASLQVPDGVRARLDGVIALERKDYAAASRAFERALRAERSAGQPADPQVSLYLAHTYLRLERYDRALAAIEATRSLAGELVAQPLVEAQALLGADRLNEAYGVLRAAVTRFPDELAPRLELVDLASRMSLLTVARVQAEQLLRLELDRDSAMAVIQALHRDSAALPLLERVVARFPNDSELRAHLAHGYAVHGTWYAAGFLFEQATLLGGDYAFEAADQYRLAGAIRRALAMNGRVVKPDRRLRQRLSILYSAGEMARVVALEAELVRRGLDDDATVYRLAYAHFSLSEYAQATRLASRLIGTGFESQARSLLGVMGRTASSNRP